MNLCLKRAKKINVQFLSFQKKIRQRRSEQRHLTTEHFVLTHLTAQHPFLVDIFCSFQVPAAVFLFNLSLLVAHGTVLTLARCTAAIEGSKMVLTLYWLL